MRRPGSLYLCYMAVTEPLVETQVIAYLQGLAQAGYRIHLLTYEFARPTRSEARAIRTRLAAQGITWHWTRYHKRPTVPATVLDAIWGAVRGVLIVSRYRLGIEHARVHVPAASALIMSKLTRFRLIFDVRGLMAEEYVDAGRWQPGGLPYRLTKAVERRALARADGIVVLTRAALGLIGNGAALANARVIPCCVDLAKFDGAEERRSAIRDELGLGDRPVVVYAGKFTGWYAEREMVEFFSVARRVIPNLHFLVLSQSDHDLIRTEFRRLGIATTDFTVMRVAPDRIPEVLSAADFGLTFVRPSPSKVASWPTKNGEYLAAGLPFVATAGVGGNDDVAAASDAVVLIDRFDQARYHEAAERMRAAIDRPRSRAECQAVAERLLSLEATGIPRYLDLYSSVTAAPGGAGS